MCNFTSRVFLKTTWIHGVTTRYLPLITKALKYSCINQETKLYFQFDIIITISASFKYHVMGLRRLYIVLLFQYGDQFKTSEVDPRTERDNASSDAYYRVRHATWILFTLLSLTCVLFKYIKSNQLVLIINDKRLILIHLVEDNILHVLWLNWQFKVHNHKHITSFYQTYFHKKIKSWI